jgi:enoyl-CoA hydratase
MIDFIQRGPLGLITLNRPQALNAVNAAMARAMLQQLQKWADDPAIERVAVQGVGKAFCAGGDIRAVYEMGADAMRFFKPEYDLCRLIHAYPKPYIALMDGITFGGGVGISIYGSHRIATPHTLWAMPECAIGFYPDIGATWFLPRLPGEVGTYLALTGARLKAGDLLALGIANGFADEGDAYTLSLTGEGWGEGALPAPELAPSPASLRLSTSPVKGEVRKSIDRCFAYHSVEEIVAALGQEQSDWAGQTLAALSRAAPTSLKVTLRQMRIGKTLTFDQAIDLEYRLTKQFLGKPDFFEGVRAALIDRDGAPRWQPDDLSAVSDEIVGRYFL